MNLAAAQEIAPRIVKIRRELHQIPELGQREHKTSQFVVDQLQQIGVDSVETGVGGMGVVATIKGNNSSGRMIGLRADMDGLPIVEQNRFAHRSRHEGAMHACGHDGHTAMLIGAASLLCQTRDFDGTVVLIFQPAEEGLAGAREMVRDGLFSRYPIQEIYALHNWPELPLGEIGVCTKSAMAARDDFQIEIIGNGGHAAQPHRTTDPILVGARVIEALQSIVSREIDPKDSAVVSVHSIRSGNDIALGQPTENASIPDRLLLGGIAKWLLQDTGTYLEKRLRHITESIAAASGARANVVYEQFLPPVINDTRCAGRVTEVAQALISTELVNSHHPPTMASEDFSFMLQAVPGAYFFLGTGGPAQKALHHPQFDFNDDSIALGIAVLSQLVLG